MKTILSRYLFAELFIPTVLGLFIFTFMFMANQTFLLMDLVVVSGINIKNALMLIISLLPYLMTMTLPMAILWATIFTYGKLSEKNEISAMLASGISYRSIMLPGVLLGICATIFLLFWSNYAGPRALNMHKVARQEIARDMKVIGLEEGCFNTRFPGLILYIKEIERTTCQLKGITIWRDETEEWLSPTVICAPIGKIRFNHDKLLVTMTLENGTIYHPRKKEFIVSSFKEMRHNIDVSKIMKRIIGRSNTLAGLSRESLLKKAVELKQGIAPERFENSGQMSDKDVQEYRQVVKEYHKRVSMPFSCLCMILIAVPLGILSGKGRHSISFVLAIFVVLSYYMFLAIGEACAEAGIINMFWGLWIPNIALALAGVIFCKKVFSK